jgi:general secretion pathway protein L
MSLLTSDNQAQLFGLDLRAIWQDAASVARAMASRPPLSWLTPTQRVHLLGADGHASVWASRGGLLRRLPQVKTVASKASHVAVEMPQAWLLRHAFQLPKSSAAQAVSAARLEVLRLSPFPAAETVWGCAVDANASEAAVTVHLVLCARSHVEASLSDRKADLGKAVPEVWALEGALPVVLAGFGESARERQTRSGLGWALFWLLLALGWGAAMALTPSLQLRETALDAQAKFAAIGKLASNAMGQREALLAANSRLKEVDDALANRADPKLAIEVLTKALDDGVFLQRLDVKGRNVSMSGQAANATALVQTLSGVTGLEDVKSTAAATRQLNGTERFTIDFVLKPPPQPSAEAPALGVSDKAVKP